MIKANKLILWKLGHTKCIRGELRLFYMPQIFPRNVALQIKGRHFPISPAADMP